MRSCAPLRVGFAAALLAVVSPGGVATAATEGAFRHLQALQDIATANGGNRAAGTPGFDRSAEYVAEQLRAAGYAVRFEEFNYTFFEERSPPVLLVSMPDGSKEAVPAGLRTLRYSAAGDVSAPLRTVNLQLDAPRTASNSGCSAGDFAGFERGSVALIRRGTCQFQVKVDNAVSAGAAGVVIMNEGTDGRLDGFPGSLTKPASIPVVGVPFEFGRSLAALADAGVTVHLAVNVAIGSRSTRNVLADIATEGSGPSIVVGAHLDSVQAGPGINDNGSGSAAVLEAALQLATEPVDRRSRIGFAFWGAEEQGLIGSQHHVEALSDAARGGIGVYINLDMVGSPNYVRVISSSGTDGLAAIVRRELLASFHDQNAAVEERPPGGPLASDDGPFRQKEIPAVSLSTTEATPKTEDQVHLFGGVTGTFDSCYHKACDTIDNVNRDVLDQNTRALVHALEAASAVAASSGTP